MRRRKWRWVVGGLALAALAAVGAFVLWPSPDRITRENYDRITEGMSRAEVYEILGPPGDYRTGPQEYRDVIFAEHPDGFPLLIESPHAAVWLDDRAAVCVFFKDERVEKRDFPGYSSAEKESRSPLDNLLWRAKRLWRKWFP